MTAPSSRVLILLPPVRGQGRAPARAAARPRDAVLPGAHRARARLAATRWSTLCAGDPENGRRGARPRPRPSSPWSPRTPRSPRRPTGARRRGLHRRPLRRARPRHAVAAAAQAPRRHAGSRRLARCSALSARRPDPGVPALAAASRCPARAGRRRLARAPRPGACPRPLGDGLVVDLRSSAVRRDVAPAGRARRARRHGAGAARGPRASARWSATSTRRPRAGSCAALLESGADPRTPEALADALRGPRLARRAGRPRGRAPQLDVVVTDL